ncbi:MAG TPA: leucine-rich repeat protein [Methanomassiliicoccaceae archaeon]|nr:leucine-rich repeat protein [Methanomassiliicoccaceae archaeon]
MSTATEAISPEDFEYEVKDDGTVEITGYNGEEVDLIIPEEIDGKLVTSIAEYAFYQLPLESVTIPDGVESIGDYAFYWCEELTSVIIGNGVTSIGEEAFSYCYSLTSVDIPDGVSYIGDYAFSDCHSLPSIDIPASVTSIGKGAFAWCPSLTSITVDPANPNYASIAGVLYNKDQTTLMQCPGGEVGDEGRFVIPSSVTIIFDDAFGGCEFLTEITIPDTVTRIGDYAFSDCHSLPSIDIPASVTYIGNGTFGWCPSLETIDVDEENPNYASIDGVL